MCGKRVRQGLQLVQSKSSKSKFRVGEVIPASGIYDVLHSDHRVRHDVTLLKDEKFPPCNKCGANVYFELVREAPKLNQEHYDFKVRLFEIPHPEEEEQAEETA